MPWPVTGRSAAIGGVALLSSLTGRPAAYGYSPDIASSRRGASPRPADCGGPQVTLACLVPGLCVSSQPLRTLHRNGEGIPVERRRPIYAENLSLRAVDLPGGRGCGGGGSKPPRGD